MAANRVKKRARPSANVASGTTDATASPMSLPPSGTVHAVVSSSTDIATTEPADKKPYWYKPKSSKMYEQAIRIFAMRAAGLSDKEIASAIGLAEQSLWNICSVAGKNGWVSDQLASAKDVVEFQILPKVLREIEVGLDDTHRNEKTGLQVKTQVALRVAEGAIWPKFQQAPGGPIQNQTAIAIRIETVPGPPQLVREGAISGTPAYTNAEVVDVEQSGLV